MNICKTMSASFGDTQDLESLGWIVPLSSCEGFHERAQGLIFSGLSKGGNFASIIEQVYIWEGFLRGAYFQNLIVVVPSIGLTPP